MEMQEQVRCVVIYTLALIHLILCPNFCPLLISLCPQGRISIMCRLFELLPLPCPSHKTMMSWYSRQCQLQLAELSLSFSLSLLSYTKAFKREHSIHVKTQCTHLGMCKSYSTSKEGKLRCKEGFSSREHIVNKELICFCRKQSNHQRASLEQERSVFAELNLNKVLTTRLSSDLPSYDTVFDGLLAMPALSVSLRSPPTPVRFIPSLPSSMLESDAILCRGL